MATDSSLLYVVRNKAKNNAWKSLNRDISQTNKVSYRKANALLKKKKYKSEKEAANAFTSTILSTTPTSTIWNYIRRFCGLQQSKQNLNNTLHTTLDQHNTYNTIHVPKI